MGKRKKKSKPPPKKKMKTLDKTFFCPFCNHSDSVECCIDIRNLTATAKCWVCLESFSTTANVLTEPVDVYSEWIDECERVNNNVGDDNDN
ncbi:hypothetical protein IEQ34_020627 [Dendrobium chrysotoxum]|uniref:Transcription elongation factor 1 homolog n=1 Tax=Dendrobium chrysotoxum TaxID=161865 RepID=A0AAV7G1F2_DENCH|nr:hypothetical protein IEQ34_020627 [Dendrobium chrysotoxum]